MKMNIGVFIASITFSLASHAQTIDSALMVPEDQAIKLQKVAELPQAMWTHGTSIQIEFPNNLSKVWRAGFYTEVEGKPNTNNWFHFAIPTTVIVNDKRLKIGSVMLLCETLSEDAVIHSVHIYDGPNKLVEHSNLNLSGNIGFRRFDVPAHPQVLWGIGISVGVTFKNGSGSKIMRFSAAGCDFLP